MKRRNESVNFGEPMLSSGTSLIISTLEFYETASLDRRFGDGGALNISYTTFWGLVLLE